MIVDFLQNFKILQCFKVQLDCFVDFEKYCRMRIWLQKSVSMQPRTSRSKRAMGRSCCEQVSYLQSKDEAPRVLELTEPILAFDPLNVQVRESEFSRFSPCFGAEQRLTSEIANRFGEFWQEIEDSEAAISKAPGGRYSGSVGQIDGVRSNGKAGHGC